MIRYFFRRLFPPRRRAEPASRPPVIDPAFSQPAAKGREALQALLAGTQLPGLQVAVGYRNCLVWVEGIGYADRESQQLVTPDTQFRIASVTKVLTTAALARLWQAGRLDLDTPIAAWLPDWPHAPERITPRLLAGHLGGIRHYFPEDFKRGIDYADYPSAADALRIFRGDPLVAAPGELYHYTTYGYTLLSAVMERATGLSFFSVMKDQVLQPLGLRDTVPNHPNYPAPRLTTLYTPGKNGDWKVFANSYPRYKWAGGGYVSTAEDLARFGMAHLRDGFLSEAAREQLFTPQHTSAGHRTGVGLGWVITRDAWGRIQYFHNGSQGGARSLLALYPEQDLVVALLSNGQNVPDKIEQTGSCLADLFLRPAVPFEPGPLLGDWRCLTEGQAEARVTFTGTQKGLVGAFHLPPASETKAEVINTGLLIPAGNGFSTFLIRKEGLIPLRLEPDGAAWQGTIHLNGSKEAEMVRVRLIRLPV